uniref:Myeloid-specific peroxidase n=1 Tax=Salarias fasciatus TaxID=181472 RepID=A0A672JIV5_SALFA
MKRHPRHDAFEAENALETVGQHFDSPLLERCFEDARKIVDEAYTYSRQDTLRRVRRETVSPHDALRILNEPRGETRSAVRSADYMAQTLRLFVEKSHHIHKRSLNATDSLSQDDLMKLSDKTGCAAQIREPQCNSIPNINKYRTITGVCNNLKATRKGASNTPLVRWQPAEYDDGISEPKGNRSERINNFFLPLVRQVSNNILRMMDAEVVNDTEITRMVTIYSQWNDHDLSFTPFSPSIRSFSNGVNCDESCQRGEPCIPIPIPPGDPHLPTDSCIPAFRSAGACGTGFPAYNFSGTPNVRQQINAATAFLDISQVYGSEEKLALDLRNLTDDGGLLKVNEEFTDNGREVLPFHPLQVNACATRRRVTNDTNAREIPCFIAGDVRVDENAALTSLHTLFLREHNRLARELRRLNPQWDSETLYQEARKIMGAYTQVFAFKDYLSHILGEEAVKNMTGNYTGYNHSVDPSISNVFATAAYRFAHLAIQPTFSHLGANYLQDPQFGNIPVFEAFFTPWRILFEIGIDSVLRGLIGRPAELKFQNHTMVDALRERLFQFVQQIALDLGSLNMQRGRDHGLPGYNTWRKFCGLSQPRNQAELARVLNNEDLARSLFQHYGTPDNIDVWLAGVAEPFVTGGRVGSLFACLIARQFKNIRDGDRLWYENSNVFSTRQRAALSRASLARIICDNTGITSMPRDVFSVISSNNSVTPCSAIPRLDLAAWKQRPCTGAGCSPPARIFQWRALSLVQRARALPRCSRHSRLA